MALLLNYPESGCGYVSRHIKTFIVTLVYTATVKAKTDRIITKVKNLQNSRMHKKGKLGSNRKLRLEGPDEIINIRNW
jgi:hypothetical protein